MQCLICGAVLSGKLRKYCPGCNKQHINEMAREAYRKKRGPRHCKRCGVEVPDSKQFCDICRSIRWKECESYQNWLKDVNDQADIKRREFIESGDFGEFEYVGGFTSGNCKIVLRCKTCGEERMLTIDGVRSATNGHNASLRCKKCHPNKGCRRWDEWLEAQRERWTKQKVLTAARMEEEKQKRLRTAICKVCGNEFQTYCPTQKTCGGECSKRYRNRKNDHRIKNDAIVDRDITLATLFQRDKGVCYICGCQCNWNDIRKDGDYVITGPKYPSIDHVIPISRGGKHSWTNIRLACRECNSKKTDMDPVKFLGTDDFIPDDAEILKRVPNPNKKTVKQSTSTGEVIAVYESAAQAARETGFKERQIQNCARGECKTYRGFLWAYC